MTTLYDQIKQIFDSYGVPSWIWYPIAIAESGGRPNAVGDNGCSIGLFQLNMCGGQGQGYTAIQLADPLFNARIAAIAISNAWNQVKGTGQSQADQLSQVMQLSGHGGAVSTALNALSNFLGRGSLPAPEFGGIFKLGFFPGMIPIVGTPPSGFDPYAGYTTGTTTGFNFLGINWDLGRIGVGALGVTIILIALIAFLWKPATQAAKEGAKVAGTAAVAA